MTISIEQAQLHLADLVRKSRLGEKVVITEKGQAAVELVPVVPREKRPGFGALKGKIRIIADDDEHLADFKEYME